MGGLFCIFLCFLGVGKKVSYVFFLRYYGIGYCFEEYIFVFGIEVCYFGEGLIFFVLLSILSFYDL